SGMTTTNQFLLRHPHGDLERRCQRTAEGAAAVNGAGECSVNSSRPVDNPVRKGMRQPPAILSQSQPACPRGTVGLIAVQLEATDSVPSPSLEQAREFARLSKAENTLRGYRADWLDFCAWCHEHRFGTAASIT